MSKKPVILLYRRDHMGDPGIDGAFGINGCMGRVRDWYYDAVVAVGAKTASDKGLRNKVNWIGIGPSKNKLAGDGHALVEFKHFILLNNTGPLVSKSKWVNLYDHLFEQGKVPRAGKYFPPKVQIDLEDILSLAVGAPPSLSLNKKLQASKRKGGCK